MRAGLDAQGPSAWGTAGHLAVLGLTADDDVRRGTRASARNEQHGTNSRDVRDARRGEALRRGMSNRIRLLRAHPMSPATSHVPRRVPSPLPRRACWIGSLVRPVQSPSGLVWSVSCLWCLVLLIRLHSVTLRPVESCPMSASRYVSRPCQNQSLGETL